MSVSVAVAPVAAQRAPAGLLGLHGLKRRWLAAAVRDGLQRDSAAWFAVGERTSDEERHATLAACVYHALGLTVAGDLASRTAPGGYQALFESHPDQLPAILAFGDEPSGREAWRRYRWVGPPTAGVTAPYTKVERAGRTAGPWRRPRVFAPGLAELAQIERTLDRGRPSSGSARLVRATGDDTPTAIVDTKLARFCCAVADLAGSGLFRALAEPGW